MSPLLQREDLCLQQNGKGNASLTAKAWADL